MKEIKDINNNELKKPKDNDKKLNSVNDILRSCSKKKCKEAQREISVRRNTSLIAKNFTGQTEEA